MEYRLSLTEAKVLIIASQAPVRENYADAIAVKINSSSSHVAGCIRRLQLARYLTIVKTSRRSLIENLSKEALQEAREIIIKAGSKEH